MQVTKRLAEGGQREAEWLAGLISGQPRPPRDVAFRRVLAAIGWRFFAATGFFVALGLVFAAIALAAGSVVLRVGLAGLGLFTAGAFVYYAGQHVLEVRAAARTGVVTRAELLQLRVQGGSSADWRDLEADGTLLVRHPKGDFRERLEVTPRRWISKAAPGDEIEVVVDPARKRVLVYLGPPEDRGRGARHAS